MQLPSSTLALALKLKAAACVQPRRAATQRVLLLLAATNPCSQAQRYTRRPPPETQRAPLLASQAWREACAQAS